MKTQEMKEKELKPCPLSELLWLDQPWDMPSIVSKLIEATTVLLDEKDYDGHGWENIHRARELALEWCNKLPAAIAAWNRRVNSDSALYEVLERLADTYGDEIPAKSKVGRDALIAARAALASATPQATGE